MKRFIFFKMVLLIIGAFLSSQAMALMIGLSTEKLTQASDVVVRGQVEETRSQWSEDGKIIVTRALVRVASIIKGHLVKNTVWVEYEGGEVGGIGLKVSDVASLREGEEVILFLTPEKKKGKNWIREIVGHAQGKYSIGADHIARKQGFSVLKGKDLVDDHLTVDELIGKIKAAVHE